MGMWGPPETPPRGALRESEAHPTGRDLRLCRILQNGASKMGANFGYARFAAVSEHPHHGQHAPHSPSTCGFPGRQHVLRSQQSPQTSHSRQSRPSPDFDFARPCITERNALAGRPPSRPQEPGELRGLARRGTRPRKRGPSAAARRAGPMPPPQHTQCGVLPPVIRPGIAGGLNTHPACHSSVTPRRVYSGASSPPVPKRGYLS